MTGGIFPTWPHQCSHPTCSSYSVKLTVLHWQTESLFLNQSGLYNNLQQLNAEGWCLETLLGRRKWYHFFWVLSVSLLSSAPSCHVVRKPRPHGGVPANSSGKNPSQPPDMWMNMPSDDSDFQPLNLPTGVPDLSGQRKATTCEFGHLLPEFLTLRNCEQLHTLSFGVTCYSAIVTH